jgi:hypothetical protein
VYGIRTLFMAVVMSTSILAVGLVGYVAFAHRRVVRRDMSERWRLGAPVGGRENGDWWTRRYTSADEGLPTSRGASTAWRGHKVGKAGRMSIVTGRPLSVGVSPAGSSQPTSRISSRLLLGPRPRSGDIQAPQRRRSMQARAVSFLRGRSQRSDSQLPRLEELALEHERTESWRDCSDKAFSDSTSEVPSYYLKELDNSSRIVSRAEPTTQAMRDSAGIPSYYFKEHDEDGRPILEAEKRTSFEMRECGVPARKPELAVDGAQLYGKEISVKKGKVVEGTDYKVQSQCGSLSETTVVNEDGRQRSLLSGRGGIIADIARASEAKAGDDEGWETVYCSGWKGREV